MKKHILFLNFVILLFLLALPACQKDNDNDEPLTESIILGKWEVLSMRSIGYVNKLMLYDNTETYEANENVLEFLAGGDGKMYEYDEYIDDFAWELNGNVLTIDHPEMGVIELKTSLNNNDLTLTYSESYEDEGTIYKLELTIKVKKL